MTDVCLSDLTEVIELLSDRVALRDVLVEGLPECGLLKFSQLLQLCELFQGLSITRSIYLKDDDILLHKNFPSFQQVGSGTYYVHVGNRIERYIKSTRSLSTMGWVWFRAKDLGLDRPCVSMG